MGKREDIKIEHVSSHKGTASHEQKGNDTADKIANAYRKLGQNTDEVEYFTEAEEQFLLKHKNILIQQDIRVFLKSLEKATMLEIWKQKAPKQAQWFVKYPQQVTKQAKQVWKWAIAAGEGQAWLYFIFAVCQWLPTNYRVHYADESGYERTKCNLCLTDSEETLAHLLVCPALAAEQESLIRVTLAKLKDWEVPWARETIETLETRTCRKLVNDAQRVLSKSIASDRLTILAHDFWKANDKKEIISSKSFIASVRKVIARADCKCERNNHSTCNIRQCYSVPLSLVKLLVYRLCLHAEARTNSLHHSTLFDHWYSEEECDLVFGAEGSMLEKSLAGRNSLLQYYPVREDKEEFNRIFSRIIDQISSKSPTRCVWIVPTSYITEIPTTYRRTLLEIACFPQELILIPPGSYRNQQRGVRRYVVGISVI